MSRIVGMDLGTTNSAVAVWEAGMPGLLADVEGRRLLPSVVYYPEEGEPVVGWEAKRGWAARSRRTAVSVKRLMGSGQLALGREPEEISAEILKALKARAEAALGEVVERAVITVPAYFNDAQRQTTKKAGELAGLSIERVLNEPTAAALAYGLDRMSERMRVAVYDLGGGTFDLSILELREGVFEVVATHGDTSLGGDDIDAAVAQWLWGRIEEAGGPVESDAGMQARVIEAVEVAKVALTTEQETKIALPFLAEEFSFQGTLTREELEGLARGVVERTQRHCRQALADAKLAAADLDQVILVGGQTRMPLVRRLVAEWFECEEYEEARGSIRMGKEFHEAAGPALNTSQNPDEAVALGAAVQAAILSGEIDQMVLLDVTPLSLGLETFGGLMNVIIPRNTTIPTKAGELFTNAVDGQREMLIHMLQGERERAQDNWSLGRFALPFQATQRGAARVGVQFEIDADGILHVLARDTDTGLEKVVKVESAVDVDDAKVQAMVEESVEHAFSDMDSRRWIEAALRAREAVKAARQGLEDWKTEVDAAGIEIALADVEAALATEENEAGDLLRLQKAVARLDEVTQPLADVMMDRAMEAMLRRRGIIG